MKKIIRSLCLFRETSSRADLGRLRALADLLHARGYEVQTQRICCRDTDIARHDALWKQTEVYTSVGGLTLTEALAQRAAFLQARNTFFHLDLAGTPVGPEHVEYFMGLMRDAPAKCFQFAFVFQNAPSAPFFPSARFAREGFAVGLQSTDLSAGCVLLDEWFVRQRVVWDELCQIFAAHEDFLGIDSSVAPLFSGDSSLVDILTRVAGDWDGLALTNTFLRITEFIKSQNPKPVGLCGLMLPCLEDFALAAAYERGQFDIERNLFLSLHSGLGIDTYPVGIDERSEDIFMVLQVLQGLSHKYQKPLSARFVADGKTCIGEKTRFHNPFLRDVRVRPLRGSLRKSTCKDGA